jgi:hypothetical protein
MCGPHEKDSARVRTEWVYQIRQANLVPIQNSEDRTREIPELLLFCLDEKKRNRNQVVLEDRSCEENLLA